jgi:general secretion pathway protein J
MIRRNEQKLSAHAAGFTLIEVLIASTISAVLIVAMYAVFQGSLSLRESTYERVESALPRSYASQALRRDFAAMTPPSGILSGPLLGERNEENTRRTDSIEFYTASAAVATGEPWGDIQKVEYRLSDNEPASAERGRDFVRVVTRNLLATTIEEPPEQGLLTGVESLEFSYYDGDAWEDSWDSTAHQDESPQAVRVRIEFAVGEGEMRGARPFESVIEVVALEMEQAESGQENGGQQPPGGGGEGGNPVNTPPNPAGQRGGN